MHPPSLARLLLASMLLATQAWSAPPSDSLDRDYADQLPRIAPLSPEEAADSFEIHPDLEIQLAAAEPLVRDPVALDFDEFGRMYVVQMRGYSEQRGDRLGSIKRLTDTDGDGRFDRAETFVDGLFWPTSVCCYDGGIFVADAPDILFLRDTDQDGRADEREVVFTGFGQENVQALLNNLQWGWDNRIHGATSRNPAVVSRPGDPQPLDLRGRDFSFDPRLRQLRPETGGGQHGMTFDAWGNKYFCSNSDHIRLVLSPDRYLARNPLLISTDTSQSIAADGPAATVYRASPVEPWRIVRTRLRVQGLVPGPVEGGGRPAGYFTSATGLLIYTGDALPPQYRGRAMVGDVGSNLVHQKEIEWQGTMAVARRVDAESELLRSTDVWFRPVQLANGPDGALYVLDMYREVIEHPWSLPPIIKKHIDLTSGRERGRIWRITSRGHVSRPRRLPGSASDAQLVEMLAHPNGWHRLTAARLLCTNQPASEDLAGRLRTFLRQSPGVGRMHSLAVLAQIDQLEPADIQIGLQDPSPWVRVRAVQLSESLPTANWRELRELTRDPDIRVRRQLAFTIGNAPEEHARPVFAELTFQDGDDPSMRQALLSSAHPNQLKLLALLLQTGNAGQLQKAEPVLVELARQGAQQDDLQTLAAALEACIKHAPGTADRLLAVMWKEAAGSRDKWQSALAALPAVADRLAALQRRSARDALNPQTPLAERLEAVERLPLLEPEALENVLEDLLGASQPVELQRAAVNSAGQVDYAAVAKVLLDRLQQLTPQVRREALGVVMSRPEWIDSMLTRVENGQLPSGEFDPATRQALLEHPDPQLRHRASELLASHGPASSGETEQRLARILQLDSDAAAGVEVFRQHCAACHVGDQQPAIAPPLDAIRARGASTLLANLMDPNREVDPRYITYTVLTIDGRVLTGIIASESANSIELVTADAVRHPMTRREIDELRRGSRSLMPDGFGQILTDQQLADLLAYILSDPAELSPDEERLP